MRDPKRKPYREPYCNCTGDFVDSCTGNCNPKIPEDDFEDLADPPGEAPENDLAL